jgi:hypothetical protein
MNSKTTHLLLIVFLFSSVLSFAQSGLEINFDPDGVGPSEPLNKNLASDTHKVNLSLSSPELAGGVFEPHFIVKNKSEDDKQLRLARKIINVPIGWTDQLCWPPNCYNATGKLYTTPNTEGNPAPTIVAGTSSTTNKEKAEIKPRITVDQSSGGFAHYRYYIIDANTNKYLDSLDLIINLTLSVLQQKNVNTLTMAPNPADHHTTITINSTEPSSCKIVDALGKTVLAETIYNGSRSLDVADLRNGVYIALIEVDGKTVTKKLIVRH